MAFLEAHDIVKSYQVGGTLLPVLRNLDIEVAAGEMLAIVGASGVGKSTLLHVLGGLDTIDGGQVRVGDHEISTMTDETRVAFRNRHIGFVFQFHHLLPEFTAIENAMMPMRIARVSAADAPQKLGRAQAGVRQGHSRDAHRHLGVLERVEFRQQVVELKDEADALVAEGHDLWIRQGSEIDPTDGDGATVDAIQPAEHVEQGALAYP